MNLPIHAHRTQTPFSGAYISPLTGKRIVAYCLITYPAPEITSACYAHRSVCQQQEQGAHERCRKYRESARHLRDLGRSARGIYVFIGRHSARLYYIGQTNDIAGRVSTHNRSGNLLERIRLRAQEPLLCEVHVMDDPFERFYWEQHLIDKYHPRFNVVAPA